MTESVPTTRNDERDAAFFGIAGTLAADGFADDNALLASAEFAGDGMAAQIEKVLTDLVAAESWESMSMRSAGAAKPELVPLPVPGRRARRSGELLPVSRSGR